MIDNIELTVAMSKPHGTHLFLIEQEFKLGFGGRVVGAQGADVPGSNCLAGSGSRTPGERLSSRLAAIHEIHGKTAGGAPGGIAGGCGNTWASLKVKKYPIAR